VLGTAHCEYPGKRREEWVSPSSWSPWVCHCTASPSLWAMGMTEFDTLSTGECLLSITKGHRKSQAWNGPSHSQRAAQDATGSQGEGAKSTPSVVQKGRSPNWRVIVSRSEGAERGRIHWMSGEKEADIGGDVWKQIRFGGVTRYLKQVSHVIWSSDMGSEQCGLGMVSIFRWFGGGAEIKRIMFQDRENGTKFKF
jgi:hypothetical protein